jgi:Asp-tRNA(Asn)/Glu-tRNA(Gln) amidotransferase C subunit
MKSSGLPTPSTPLRKTLPILTTVNGLSNVFREDVVAPSYGREEILKNAESREDGYFLVRRRR